MPGIVSCLNLSLEQAALFNCSCIKLEGKLICMVDFSIYKFVDLAYFNTASIICNIFGCNLYGLVSNFCFRMDFSYLEVCACLDHTVNHEFRSKNIKVAYSVILYITFKPPAAVDEHVFLVCALCTYSSSVFSILNKCKSCNFRRFSIEYHRRYPWKAQEFSVMCKYTERNIVGCWCCNYFTCRWICFFLVCRCKFTVGIDLEVP